MTLVPRDFAPARPLDERRARGGDSSVPPDAWSRAHQHRKAWRAAVPFGPPGPTGTARGTLDGDELWRRRLAAIGASEESFLALLAEPATADDPDWADQLAAIYADRRLADLGLRLCAGHPETDTAKQSFLVVAEPLVGWAREQFVGRMASHLHAVDRHGELSRLPAPEHLAELLLRGLLPRLNGIAHRTFLLELAVEREAGRLSGETGEQRLASFVSGLRGTRWALLTRYPVLARQLFTVVRAWLDHASELAARLAADLPALLTAFSPGTDPGTVTDVVDGLGDPHRGGRTVAMVRFSAGLTVMYKPRSVALDVHFGQLLDWLNEHLDPDRRLRVAAALDRGDYGWTEYVEAAPRTDQQQRRRLFRRHGALLAVLYLVQATDFHLGNLVIAGEYPVPVDLETLFQPELPALDRAGSSAAERAAHRLNSGSVLRSGLLPNGVRPWEPTDLAGIGGGAARNGRTRFAWAHVDGAGTDRMRVRMRQPVPETRGDDGVRPADYLPEIVDGFTEVYRILQRHRADLLAGPIAAFAEDEVRYVARDTAIYALLLSTSTHPSLLTDAADRDRHFDRLWYDVVDRPGFAELCEAERQELWRHDIPVFTVTASGGPLRSGTGRPIADLPVTPGLAVVRDLVERLGEDDLARQTWLIRMCVTSNLAGTERTAESARLRAAPAAKPATPDRVAAAADAVARRLCDIALYAEGEAVWVGPSTAVDQDGQRTVGTLGPGLYDGLLGVALFLAHHSRVRGDDRAGALAHAAARAALRQIRRGAAVGHGLLGYGGVSYALAHLAMLVPDTELARELVAEPIPVPDVAADAEYEVMSGAAGTLFGLAAQHRVRPVHGAIRAVADHLIEAQREHGASWLPRRLVETGLAARPLVGFAHGTAGVAGALAIAAELLDDDRYLRAAARAVDYERELFDERTGDWPDLRDPAAGRALRGDRAGASDPVQQPVAWCHGAPGVGISRVLMADHLDVRADIDRAVAAATRNVYGDNHSLCHGDLGRLDFLLLAGTGGEPHPRVAYQTATVLDTADTDGWLCGLRLAGETPGLFTGLAGIGYGLLRLLDPYRVPSVLALRLPA